jgi:hypothetical protein
LHAPFTPPLPRFIRRCTRGCRALPLAAVTALAVVTAGCGGGSANRGVAQIGTSTAPTSTGTTAVSGPPSPEAYAKCMRSHGVPTFPDPNSKGGVNASAVTNLNSPQYRKAQDVCRPLLPSGDTLQGGSLTPQQQAQLLKFSRCMRSHGVPKFPDPTTSGLSPSGVDPNTSQFQAAQNVCSTLLPNRGHGSVQSTGGGRKP